MNVSTVKIKATDPEQGDFIIINEDDFDAKKHELYVEAAEKPKTKAELKAEAALKAALEAEKNGIIK